MDNNYRRAIRKGLRQVFACIFIIYSATFVLIYATMNQPDVWVSIALSLYCGVIAGPILWAIYRVIRFTFSSD